MVNKLSVLKSHKRVLSKPKLGKHQNNILELPPIIIRGTQTNTGVGKLQFPRAFCAAREHF